MLVTGQGYQDNAAILREFLRLLKKAVGSRQHPTAYG